MDTLKDKKEIIVKGKNADGLKLLIPHQSFTPDLSTVPVRWRRAGDMKEGAAWPEKLCAWKGKGTLAEPGGPRWRRFLRLRAAGPAFRKD